MEYATKTRNVKIDNRKRAMPDNFGKPRTEVPTGPIDAQLTQRDNRADETRPLRNEEKELRKDAERDVIDATDFKPPSSDNQAPPPVRTTTNEPTAVTELRSAFAKCWTTVDDISIPSVTYYDKSTYIPLGINLFQILFATEDVLNGNEELRWISPMYFSLPVRVYYAVIFFVQILRARETSGTLSKPDSSFLRAFLRRFKDTSCTIAGPLVPFFTNLTACLPDDKQYDTVTPTLPLKGTYSVTHEGSGSTAKQTLVVDPLHHVLPSVPLIGSLLRKFATSTDLTDCFSPLGEFVPVPDAGGQFAGIDFPPKTGEHWNNEYAQVISNPALMRPLPESEFKLREIHQHWRRSAVRHFPNITTTTPFTPEGPGSHTQLIDDFNWFQVCIDMATIHARFFADSTNLSQIPVLGGRSTLVVAELRVINPSDDKETKRPSKVEGWYPDLFSSLKASFYSLTPVLNQDDEYNAIYSLTNGTVNWKTPTDTSIGSKDAGHRSGPYWDNGKRTFELEHPRAVSTGLYNLVQTLFYSARPTQN
jgi:hypothetical protein